MAPAKRLFKCEWVRWKFSEELDRTTNVEGPPREPSSAQGPYRLVLADGAGHAAEGRAAHSLEDGVDHSDGEDDEAKVEEARRRPSPWQAGRSTAVGAPLDFSGSNRPPSPAA